MSQKTIRHEITFVGLDRKLAFAVSETLPMLGLVDVSDGITVTVKKCDELSVKWEDNGVTIKYVKDFQFFRMLSFVPRVIERGGEIRQEAGFSMLCYMADMSRNAVFNIPSAKRMIRYLALMGYDSLMLYTEDTFELEGYPSFGHMRGRFTNAELKEIDDYAFAFGIEVIPCVQTLAHLATALRWSAFGMKDIDDILFAGDEKTYAFVDAVLRNCRACFRSDRINIGMDEASLLGRGKYLDKNGYRPSHEIMREHMEKVVSMCDKYGYHPMMWSDMFFRMAFNGRYYVTEGEVPQEIIDGVPKNLTLIYWDYYSTDEKRFTHMVDCHMKFNRNVVFAGGAWKWYGFAPHNGFSLQSAEMQLDVCKKYGLDNIIVTGWGDDGGEASQFSALPSMIYYAERAYAKKVSERLLGVRCLDCFGIGHKALMTLDSPNETEVPATHPVNPSRYLLYNDPLEGLMDAHLHEGVTAAAFGESARRLKKYRSDKNFGYMFDTLYALCNFLQCKCDMSVLARKYYREGNKEKLRELGEKTAVEAKRKLDTFITMFRKQWYTENKTFGFSVQELRLGGLKERLRSFSMRLISYANGETDKIEELEQPLLTSDGTPAGDELHKYLGNMTWRKYVTAGIL